MREPLVSIVLPVYNPGIHLNKCIDSIINQNYLNWELLIINDGSDDNSAQIAHDYCRADGRIHYFEHKNNAGVVAARNTGLKAATGKYIAFLDSDDYWSNDKLRRQLGFMQQHNYFFSFTAFAYVDEDGCREKVIEVPQIVDYGQLLKGNNIPCFTVIIDQEEINLRSIPAIRHEDYATWLNLLKDGYKAYGLNEVLGYHRLRDGSLSANKFVSALWTWNIYRDNQNLSLVKSCYYFIFYVFNGLKKHFYFH